MELPYAEVEFDADGALVTPGQVGAAADAIRTAGATDVLVLTHGWNNTPDQARALYTALVSSLVAVQPKVARAAGRTFAVVGVIWPSIQWTPPEPAQGGGAGLADPADALDALIALQVDDPTLRTRLLALAPQLDGSPTARASFVALLRGVLPVGAVDEADPDSAPAALATADAETVFEAAGAGGGLLGTGAAQGGGAGFDLGSMLGKACMVLNVFTYYTMKQRAGVVGEQGIATLLAALHTAVPAVRLSLVGHSFGGRAVTAAALVTSAPVSSLNLLQAAYSQYGMAMNWDGAGADGVFCQVPGRTPGPILVTFSSNDRAVGLAYPIASRLAGQVGAGLGDATDKYGGIGRNGALKTPAELPVTAMADVGGAYSFAPGKVSSLDSSAFIAGHSDITGPQVAYAVLTSVTTTG